VSETTVYRLIQQKKLRRYKIGRATRLSRQEVENVAVAS
jgi:excisionase family DNA binding protein